MCSDLNICNTSVIEHTGYFLLMMSTGSGKVKVNFQDTEQ